MSLPVESGIKLIRKAYEGRTHDLLMKRWLNHTDGSISFDEFKRVLEKSRIKAEKRKIDESKTKEEIMKEVEETLSSYRGGGSNKSI